MAVETVRFVACPSCGRPISAAAKMCPYCADPFVNIEPAGEPGPIVPPPPIMQSRARGVSPFIPLRPRKRSALGRYVDRCGIRSVIFQGILAGWTILSGGFFFLMCMRAAALIDAGRMRTSDASSALGILLFFVGIPWVFLAVPLAIAAVATLNTNNAGQRPLR